MSEPGDFDAKLARLEAIVKTLEGAEPSLDDAVKLFKEGKTLAAECEALLKSSQQQIDVAMGDAQSSAG
jgi:exodeoxyribonuclease VII small subunit